MEASSSEPAFISVCFQSFDQLQKIPYINDLLPKNPSAYSLEVVQKVVGSSRTFFYYF